MTTHHGALVLFGAFVVSLVVGEAVRRLALRHTLLDAPNHRSLHVAPTPRLGGVAVVATTSAGALLVVPDPGAQTRALVGLCLALSLVGLHDDIKPLSSAFRFALQVALAGSALWLLGVPSLVVAPGVTFALPAWLLAPLLGIWIVAVLNICNFMDGMDGLAGTQTVIAASVLALLLDGGAAHTMLLLAAASLAFLVHNYPPARMFLGDAGSTFIGMLLAGAAVLGMHRDIAIGQTALAFAPFLLDGTFTILRRAGRGEKVWEAHRSHLYQRAVTAGRTHREVLLVYTVWMAVSAGAALVAGRSPAALLAAWSCAIAGLALVHRWVRGLESERSDPA